jgi:hypothetical protein
MVTTANMCAVAKSHDATQSGGENVADGAPSGRREDTSYARDFGAAPALSAASRAHFVVNRTRRDFMDDGPLDSRGGGGGRSGARGPLTRHAEESGSVDAPSVWADEYALLTEPRPRREER